jgi:glycosyltransferase involved in cell wall biosynthesis
MEGATVPIVWEINAPCNERLAFLDLKRTNNAGRGFLIHADSFIRKLHRLKLASRIAYDEMVRRKYARKVEEAICVSEALERYARESLGIVRTHVVPNGADPDLFHPGHDRFDFAPKYRNHFKVLWAGSPLVPWHCLDVLQQVVKRVGEVTQEILFVVLANQITDQIPRGENVLVCEKINHGDVPRYIVAADVCLALHPEYTWSKWGFHGSTIKLFEYMGCGKVVIASRLGQIRSVVDDGRDGLLTDNSTDDVVQKILYLFEHKQEIQEMGRLARRKIVDYYNWERVADATLDIFARLCADRAVSHV